MTNLWDDTKMTAIESSASPMEILQELRVILPDVLEGSKRRLNLPLKSGDFEKTEYVEDIQTIIQKLNAYIGMLNSGLISEAEYESRKAEILSSM